jgi:hypothetical protein
MVGHVLRLRVEELEVRQAVVVPLVIAMMDDLVRLQETTEVALHHKPMLEDKPSP